MSRSKHTRPEKIRAADRVRSPREARGADDLSSEREIARDLKESGVILDEDDSPEPLEPIMPRIIVKRARPGYLHPIGKTDILRALEFFGEQCYYGLKTIKLIQGSDSCKSSTMLLGRLEVPGGIILYDQPQTPWFINGVIPDAERLKLERAGAVVEVQAGNLHTLIHWTAENLKSFMLFDVFMHEIGHHFIQQYKGKRNARVARTKDHEYFATLFSQRCRREFVEQSLYELEYPLADSSDSVGEGDV